MIKTLLHKTEKGNLYIYDDESRLSMLAHPNFENAYKKSDNADPYYLKKYDYLKNHGFFTNPKLPEFATLDESVVIDNIVNARQIVFETTESCNLNCTYCGLGEIYDITDERKEKKINEENAITFLKYIQIKTEK